MDNTAKLLNIFSNDPLGLLEVKPVSSSARNEDERLVASLEEINDFIDKHQREPQKNMKEMQEMQLYSRLKGLRENLEKIESLRSHDRHNLFATAGMVEVNSIEDILRGDMFGILDDAEDIFTLKHVPQEREQAELVAQREPCKEFYKYEHLFKECHADLKAGKRKLIKYNDRFLEEGNFFILKGVMVYLAKIHEAKKDKFQKIDGRTLCIFENGTQSNMLMRSLGKGLFDDGYAISQHKDKVMDKLAGIADEDESTGYIYILKSRSSNPEIQNIDNLYKIGFSKVEVKERIKNAQNEPTYLMAAVSIVSAYECYNMNPHKLEQLLHRFFGLSCLSIDIFDHEGQRHTPREWFIAPLEIIEQTIDMILSGKVIEYRYDRSMQMIVGK